MQNDHPLFSIIIPTFNRSRKLRRALESVSSQTNQDFEVLVCDDGSTDDTGDVVASFKNRLNLTYLYDANWGGPARPRNNGISKARGEWICFLDADDWWYPDKLAVVSVHLSNSAIVYHDLDIYPRKALRLINRMRGRHLHRPVFVDLMLRWNTVFTSSAVVRKTIIDMAGGFSEDRNLIGVEDFDLWLRISRMSEDFSYVQRSLGAYWTDESSLTEVSERQIGRITSIFNKHAPHLPEGERAQAKLLLQYSTARIKQKIGSFDDARSLFTQTVRMKNRKFRRMSLFMLYLIHCRAFLPASWLKI